MENKGKLILTEIFPSVKKHDIFLVLRTYEVNQKLTEFEKLHWSRIPRARGEKEKPREQWVAEVKRSMIS